MRAFMARNPKGFQQCFPNIVELGAQCGDKFKPGYEHGKGRPAATCSAHCSDNHDMTAARPLLTDAVEKGFGPILV